MSKVTAGGTMSLDGFIAGPNHTDGFDHLFAWYGAGDVEVPTGFPASLLYEFRLASFGTRLALWAVLGVALAELIFRLQRRQRPAVEPLAETAA